MKRLDDPKVGSGGVGNPTRIIVLDVSAEACDDIMLGISLRLLELAGDDVSLLFF